MWETVSLFYFNKKNSGGKIIIYFLDIFLKNKQYEEVNVLAMVVLDAYFPYNWHYGLKKYDFCDGLQPNLTTRNKNTLTFKGQMTKSEYVFFFNTTKLIKN